MCGKCRVKGYQCQTVTPLKWEEDYLSRGLAFGRTGIWSKFTPGEASHQRGSPTSSTRDEDTHWCGFPRIWPYSFVNATVEGSDGDGAALTVTRWRRSISSHSNFSPDALKDGRSSRHGDPGGILSFSPNNWAEPSHRHGSLLAAVSSIPRAPGFVPGTCDPLRSTLLSYYLERLCPSTVSSPVSISPFASLVFPFSISASPAVLESVLALSACHRARQEATFKDTALRLVGSVLHRLRHRLTTENATLVALDSETLIIMVMLCLFEIVNECDKRWVVHLRGARDLIRVRRQALLPQQQSTGPACDELVIFAEKFFAYQDVLGRTACGEEPIFGGDFWVSHGISSDTDPWLGCSPELVSMLCEITELSRQRADDATVAATTAFHIQTASLEARLGGLQQRVTTAPDDDILQTSAELKRLAAALYLDCALRSAHPSLPESQVAISQILRLVFVLLERHVTAGLAWPIFVAAVELNPLEDPALWTPAEANSTAPCYGRPFVLYALDKMAGSSVSNVAQTRSVIERVWQSRDMEALQDEKCLTRGQNDWERHVAPFCHGLSLG